MSDGVVGTINPELAEPESRSAFDLYLAGLRVRDPAVATAFEAMSTAHDLQQWDKVVSVGDAWVAARSAIPPTPATWYAQALQGVGRYDEAARWADVAAHGMPRDEVIPRIAAWSTYAQALCRIGHFSRAKTALETAVSIGIDHDETREKQGHMLAVLAMGAKKSLVVGGKMVDTSRLWATAWQMMESRLSQEEKTLPPSFRPWDGVTQEPVAVLHEQGMGDAILTARWLPWLAEQTGHPVTYYGPAILGKWMAALPGVVLGDFETAPSRADNGAAIRCMSLPFHQHCEHPSDMVAPTAPAALRSLRQYRTVGRPLKIGVCWQGASIGWHNFERSYTTEQFAPIWAPLPDVEFVNLQHALDVPADAPFTRVDFPDVWATGEVMTSLDLMVTVDTGVAHIAGSLGVPTIVIPPTVPDWRWMWPRGTSTPFYPSVTVVRRQRANDPNVIGMVRTLVENYAASLRGSSSPVPTT